MSPQDEIRNRETANTKQKHRQLERKALLKT
jgi:hypothetical protein